MKEKTTWILNERQRVEHRKREQVGAIKWGDRELSLAAPEPFYLVTRFKRGK
jgi:hypothetical protein